MVKKKESEIVLLSNIHLLSFRGENVTISSEDQEILIKFSNTIRQDADFKFVFPIPETHSQMLRCLITEILYIAVEKDSKNIFLLTDKAGEMFLRNMLHDFHTESTDLRINLLKHQKEKIHILTSGRPPPLSSDDIAIFFRKTDQAAEIWDAKRMVCLVTLRDCYKSPLAANDFISEFATHGWSMLPFGSDNQKEIGADNSLPKLEVSIDEVRSKEISDFFKLAKESGLYTDALKQYINLYAYFYMAATIPLKWYDYYKPDSQYADEFVESMLPSQSASKIPNIGAQQSITLQAICQQTEKALHDDNPKYKKIASAARSFAKEGGSSAILMPNKIIADMYAWSLFEAKMARGLLPEDVSLFYPEDFFINSLLAEQRFKSVIIPFVPGPELIAVAKNLAPRIQFILYPYEKKLLNDAIQDTALLDGAQWFAGRNVGGKFAFLAKEGALEESMRRHAVAAGTAKQSAYSRFLTFLAKGDPKEGDRLAQYSSVIDTRTYTIIPKDGKPFKILGMDHVILVNENETALVRKYAWVAPSALQPSDNIIIVPKMVKLEQSRKAISGNLSEHGIDMKEVIRLIAIWKSALFQVQKQYPLTEIYKKLSKAGIKKDYLTVRSWFKGVMADPEKSAEYAIVEQGFNIGPRDAEDLSIFAKTFGSKELEGNFQRVYIAMKTMRTENQEMGKIAMTDVLHDIESPEFLAKCIKIGIKRIEISEAEQ